MEASCISLVGAILGVMLVLGITPALEYFGVRVELSVSELQCPSSWCADWHDFWVLSGVPGIQPDSGQWRLTMNKGEN